ncbi:methylated-DNA--[protein]-cysteine S-methyltransferase [uncultured Methanobrevibacter sp.]|uniref:methylated-DNA--[protein]-cysteine S-methyltransferase n=1 Tax=uncultured Methanobrevibacter sp. TaxID=253161 RepID=UPI00260F5D5F|nr:methylated-DNA--[protein]-cysteine S-methyltransferase [uncultured Methanobrevibacter sp.]
MYYSTKYDSPLGELFIVSDGDAIFKVSFTNNNEDCTVNDDLPIFKKVKKWFDDYFNGLNPKIDFKLNPEGSEFRLGVWNILSEIPYGQSVTYGEIASMISDNMAPQAVGGAVGANPIAIIIPCHRVLGKNGKLTGYAGGLDRKIELLKIEDIKFKMI